MLHCMAKPWAAGGVLSGLVGRRLTLIGNIYSSDTLAARIDFIYYLQTLDDESAYKTPRANICTRWWERYEVQLKLDSNSKKKREFLCLGLCNIKVYFKKVKS